jgi:hypothetical protein
MLQLMIWIPIIIWMQRRSRAAHAQLDAAFAAETVVRRPERANYQGATAPGYPGVFNSGLIALTARRLVFLTLTGKWIEILLSEITGLREARVFNRSTRGGRKHLIIQLASGEIGFLVSDNPAWINDITHACRQSKGRTSQ